MPLPEPPSRSMVVMTGSSHGVSEVVTLVVAFVAVRLIMGAALPRVPRMLDWLRRNRTGHALILLVCLIGSGTFPLWVEDSGPVDWFIGVVDLLAFGYVLVGVLTRSQNYERWARGED